MKKIIFDNKEANSRIADICMQKLAKEGGENPRRVSRLNIELKAIESCDGYGLAFYTAAVIIETIKKHYGAVHNLRGTAGSCLTSYLLGIANCDPLDLDDYEIPYEQFLNTPSGKLCFDINLDRPEFQLLNKTLAEILPKEITDVQKIDIDESFKPDETHERADVVFSIGDVSDSSEKINVSVQKTADKIIYKIFDGCEESEESIGFTIRFLRNRDVDLLNTLINLSGDTQLPDCQVICREVLELFSVKRTAGIPEFGNSFVREHILDFVIPNSFQQAIKIIGLSHASNAWIGNSDDLIIRRGYSINDVIAVREDIYNMLIKYGVERETAFEIMMLVSKGKGLTDDVDNYLKSLNVPEYFIDSCHRIKYLFPYSHAAEYCYVAFCLGWFKKHDMLKYYEIWQMYLHHHIEKMERDYGKKYPEMIDMIKSEEEVYLQELYEEHPEAIMPFN